MSRTSLVRLVGVVLLIGVGLTLFFVFRTGGDDESGTTTDNPRPVTSRGRELRSVAQRAQELTYHATYEVAGPQPTGASIAIELWRKGDRVRLDQELRDQERVVQSSGFRLPGETIGCTREGDDPWRCTAVDQQVGAEDVSADPLAGGLIDEMLRSQLEVTSETVRGHRARCYVDEASRELCVTDEGIPVRIGTEQSRIELVSLERQVGDDVFEPPAEPTQPSGAS